MFSFLYFGLYFISALYISIKKIGIVQQVLVEGLLFQNVMRKLKSGNFEVFFDVQEIYVKNNISSLHFDKQVSSAKKLSYPEGF